MIYKHERLLAYQKGLILVDIIYKCTREYPNSENHGLKSQMQRASISYVCNLVEGLSRSSLKEKRRFIEIAYGSLLELDTQSILSHRLSFIEEPKLNTIRGEIHELIKILSGLRRSINHI